MGVCLSYPRKLSRIHTISTENSRDESIKCSTPLKSSRSYEMITYDVIEMYRAGKRGTSARNSSGTDISNHRHMSVSSYKPYNKRRIHHHGHFP